MYALTTLTEQLLQFVDLIRFYKIDPEHIRLWLRTIDPNFQVNAIPDPDDRQELALLQEAIDVSLAQFLILILHEHLRL